jgi:outer membrane receptor protein involved in Fe transport
LTPELVDGVEILNGPLSAQYGDFSGLGGVHIRLKDSLPDQLTVRLQGGSFDSFRGFFTYSPQLENGSAFVAYENSRTDGPFINPLRYRRDNFTGNYTRNLADNQFIGVKVNAGRNDFFSSGQIPLDEVAAGRLDRFGFIDPFNGGRVRTGVLSAYYRKEWADGRTLKADAFLARSLFDLYSNFTFFLGDEERGDEIQQHDSRLQEGANLQILQPYKFFGRQALLTIGGNVHANQINVGLFRTARRDPFEITTSAHADVTNGAGYVQNALDLLRGHLHLEVGLRFDYFRFDVTDKVNPLFSGARGATRWQPKFSAAYAPSDKTPIAFYFNYGRGIASQDARGVVQNPDAPPISITDFYQTGAAYNSARFSVSTSLFLIDRSNEQVYIPDDGSIEFAGPSRANGYEVKTSLRLFRYFSFNAGLTQVMNAFYRGTGPRVYVDSAPHTVASGQLTFVNNHGLTAALGYRHTGNYRLDGEDAAIRAAGLDVFDLSLSQRIKRWVSFNLSLDNLFDKRYYETQNYFESRVRPGDPVIARIHGTPGYPFGVTAGLTFRFLGK